MAINAGGVEGVGSYLPPAHAGNLAMHVSLDCQSGRRNDLLTATNCPLFVGLAECMRFDFREKGGLCGLPALSSLGPLRRLAAVQRDACNRWEADGRRT